MAVYKRTYKAYSGRAHAGVVTLYCPDTLRPVNIVRLTTIHSLYGSLLFAISWRTGLHICCS